MINKERVNFEILVNFTMGIVVLDVLTPVKEIFEKGSINLNDLQDMIKGYTDCLLTNTSDYQDRVLCYIQSYITKKLPFGSIVEIKNYFETVNGRDTVDSSFPQDQKIVSKNKFIIKWSEELDWAEEEVKFEYPN
jgi:hypothetical protein